MTDDRTPELDPRFDAAYQRGSAGAAAPRRDPLPELGAWADRGIGLPPAPREHGLRPEPARLEPSRDGRPDPLDALGLFEAAEDEAAVDAAPVTRDARRWERTIVVVGITLVLVGVAYGFWAMTAQFDGFGSTIAGPSPWFILSQLGYQLASPIVGIGLAALVGLLFLKAVRAGRTR